MSAPTGKSGLYIVGRIIFTAIVLLVATGFNTVDENNKVAATDYYVQTNRLPAGAMWAFMTQFYISECGGKYRLSSQPSALYKRGIEELRLMRPKIRVVEANWRAEFRKHKSSLCRKRKKHLESNSRNIDLELRK